MQYVYPSVQGTYGVYKQATNLQQASNYKPNKISDGVEII